MRRLAALTLALVGAPLLAGCSTAAAAERTTAPGVLALDAAEVFGDVPRFEFAKKLQVKLPAKLAVTDVARDARPGRRLTALVTKLESDPETYSDVVSVEAGDHVGKRLDAARLEALRVEASRHQADLLVVLQRHEKIDEGHNAAAVLKILLLPMLIVPTEENRVDVRLRATVLDVRNGLIYTTVDDYRTKEFSATEAGETSAIDAALDELYEAGFDRLRDSLGPKLRALEAKTRR